MRLLKIPNLDYAGFEAIRWAIYKHIPFAIINDTYLAKQKIGYFNFWDTEYIPLKLKPFIVQPPASREPVDKLLAEMTEVFDKIYAPEPDAKEPDPIAG